MTAKWEHLGVILSAYAADDIDLMNEFGQDGWELVTVVDGIAYMKRRVYI